MSELNKINKKQIFVKKHLSNCLIGDSIKPSTGNVTGNVTDNVSRTFQSEQLFIYFYERKRDFKMKNVKKIAALGLSATMAMGMLPATLVSADEATGTVYYLNFKPEQADQWKELAEKYTEETGVQVDVVTAASGTYESTLKSEMAKSEAPT